MVTYVRKPKMARLTFFRSEDGERWDAITPDDVPEWVKQDEVISKIARGEAAKDPTRGKYWYGAINLGISVEIAGSGNVKPN